MAAIFYVVKFQSMRQEITIENLARLIGAQMETSLLGEATTTLFGINGVREAQEGEISFVVSTDYAKFAASSRASALIVGEDFVAPPAYKGALLRVKNPPEAVAQAIDFFCPSPPESLRGVRHHSAIIAESAQIHPSAGIGALVVVGERCVVGAGATLHAGAILYDDVHIGEGSTLHARAVCYAGTIIGKRCIIHAGAVIGADGFGFHPTAEGGAGEWTKIPQRGRVRIDDDVEIGANCAIDRASFGETRIERGVKMDNLIHIAHNVRIGEHTAIAAQTGIAGSAHIGKRNRIGGQAGIVGHISTADDIAIMAQSGVARALSEPGTYFGSPAKPSKQELRIQAALRYLPEITRAYFARSRGESSSFLGDNGEKL